MKREIKRPKIAEKILKYKKEIGIGVLALATIFAAAKPEKDKITVGIVTDIDDDNFENGVPLYEDAKFSKLVTVLQNGALIVSKDKITEETPEMYNVIAIGKKDTKVSGYMPSKYVKNSMVIDANTNLYKVDERRGVNLRSTPDIEGNNKLTVLPHGAILLSDSIDKYWAEATYLTANSMSTGFVASEYLKSIGDLSDTKKELLANKEPIHETPTLNYNVENGQVFGIDVSYIHPEALEKILTGEVKIPEIVQSKITPTVDLSSFSHRVPDFVYIRLGGTDNYSKEIKERMPSPYDKLAAVCEKLKKPYGFYYYPASINKKEAQIEYQWIKEKMKKLKTRKYNLLPMVMDIEARDENDRQYGISMEESTNVKIALTDLVEADFGKTILYTSSSAANPKFGKRILDIEQYQKGLMNGESMVWGVGPLHSAKQQKFLESINHYVASKQIALDVMIDAPGMKGQLIDINVFDAEKFKECIDGRYKNRSKNYAEKNNLKIDTVAENER